MGMLECTSTPELSSARRWSGKKGRVHCGFCWRVSTQAKDVAAVRKSLGHEKGTKEKWLHEHNRFQVLQDARWLIYQSVSVARTTELNLVVFGTLSCSNSCQRYLFILASLGFKGIFLITIITSVISTALLIVLYTLTTVLLGETFWSLVIGFIPEQSWCNWCGRLL